MKIISTLENWFCSGVDLTLGRAVDVSEEAAVELLSLPGVVKTELAETVVTELQNTEENIQKEL